MSGYIRLYRGWRDCDVFCDEPLTEREAWVWLLEKAAWKQCYRRNAKGERITVERGQFHTSLRTLAEQWGWGKNKVSRFLDRLVRHEMIGTVAGQSGCIITICNYEKYQEARDSQPALDGTVAGQSRDTQEEGKEIYSGSKEPSLVDTRPRAARIPADWEPAPLPPSVAKLAVLWPPGRLGRELDGFRDYWTARSKDAARLDWDKTWHNRIRDQHDRVMREAQNGQRGQDFRSPADKRDGVARALDRSLGYDQTDGYRAGEDGGGGEGRPPLLAAM